MPDEIDYADLLAAAPQQRTAGTRAWYRFAVAKAADEAMPPDTACLDLYDAIGAAYDGVTAKAFAVDLAALPKSVATLRMRVNSPGGNVADAIAIANMLRAHPARVEASIEGLCASAATIVTQGGADHVAIADNGLVMIHRPYAVGFGNADEMRKTAGFLDRAQGAIVATYQRRSGLSADQLNALMDAETWMDADEAVTMGFADEKTAGVEAAASIDPRALATMRIPEPMAQRVLALSRPEPKPEPVAAPEPIVPPTVTASEAMFMCEEAGLDLAFATSLLIPGTSVADAKRSVGREKERRAAEAAREQDIRALCELHRVPALAAALVGSGVSAENAKPIVAVALGLVDEIRPDPKPQAVVIDARAIYAERNAAR